MNFQNKINQIFLLGIVFIEIKAQNFPSFFDRPQPNQPSSTQTLAPIPGFVPNPFDATRDQHPHLFGTTTISPDQLMKVYEGNLSCYSCRLDFRKGYESSNQCLGRYGTNLSAQFIVNCGPTDIFCRVERTEVNGMLILLTRDCIDTCYYGCRPKGFGIKFETCSECCNGFACNNMYPESDIKGNGAGLPQVMLLTYAFQLMFQI